MYLSGFQVRFSHHTCSFKGFCKSENDEVTFSSRLISALIVEVQILAIHGDLIIKILAVYCGKLIIVMYLYTFLHKNVEL